MSSSSLSAFDDKSHPPAPDELAEVLGQALRPWDDLIAHIDAAPRFAEGRGIRLPVAAGDDLAAVRALAALKMAKR